MCYCVIFPKEILQGDYIKMMTNPMNVVSKLAPLLEKAGREILQIRHDWSNELDTKHKEGTRDVVSIADHAVKRILVKFLRQYFPDHRVDTEEKTLTDLNSEPTWIVDPIDGTAMFLGKMDLFGISLGLVHNNLPIFGIIHYPALGKTLYAMKDRGVFMNGKLLPLPKPFNESLADSLVVAEFHRGSESVYPRIRPCCRNMIIGGSFTGDVLWFVENKIAGLFHTGATRYDLAAAVIISREAGFIVSGVFEDELDFNQKNISIIMARNNSIHLELRGLLRRYYE